jgi:cellulose synthase/poly-beta-1,6-N-acetylglucosamine synthase-like glycosyltransferase
MPRRSWILAGGLAVAAGSCHVLYPAWLGWASGRVPQDPTPPRDPSPWPPVTVLVPAYREAGVIGDKVDDVRANGYPGPLEVLVVVDGDEETAAAAEKAGALVLSHPERRGKSQALNEGFAAATTPIVVISDANNRLLPGGIAALVRHFHDPSVGAVTGEKTEDDSGGESMYWRFESWLKQREWALGTTIALVGEFTAIRAEAWQPIPDDVAIDDVWTALDMSERGWRIAYEPAAKAIDPPAGSLSVQWERRTRSVANALYVFIRRPHQLGPSGGLVAAEIWGHRLGRYTISPLAHVALLGLAASRVRSSWMARLFLAGHVAGVWGLLRPPPLGRWWRAPVVMVSQVLFLQGVALGGLRRYLRGNRETTWTTVER